jgi:hypothetical protein
MERVSVWIYGNYDDDDDDDDDDAEDYTKTIFSLFCHLL